MERLDPLRVIQTLILEIGPAASGWGVDILLSAMEYLSAVDAQDYLNGKKLASIADRSGVVRSTVDCWTRNNPRPLERAEPGRILWRS